MPVFTTWICGWGLLVVALVTPLNNWTSKAPPETTATVGVFVGGTGVRVKVDVGGTCVCVAVGGTGVFVSVGGTGVSVAVKVFVIVAVGGTGLFVAVAVGGAWV